MEQQVLRMSTTTDCFRICCQATTCQGSHMGNVQPEQFTGSAPSLPRQLPHPELNNKFTGSAGGQEGNNIHQEGVLPELSGSTGSNSVQRNQVFLASRMQVGCGVMLFVVVEV